MKGQFKKYINSGLVNYWQRFEYKIINGVTYVRNYKNAFDEWRKGEIQEGKVIMIQER